MSINNNKADTNTTNKTRVIYNILEYIYKTFSISSIDLYSESNSSSNDNIKEYLKKLLYKVRDNNIKVKRLRKKRKEIKEDIEDLRVSMVSSQCFDDVQAGRNNGLIQNTTELKYIQRKELEEQLQELAIETLLLEKSLEQSNKLIEDFINLIPLTTAKQVMLMTYIDCMTNVEIASTLFLTVGATDNCRWKGLKQLEKILKQELQSQEKNISGE